MQSQKQQDDLCSCPRQTIQHHSNPRLSLTINAEETEVEQFHEYLQYFLELTPKEDVLFIIGYWNAKVGSQEIFGITGKYDVGVQNEARQRLTILFREHTGQSKHPFSTTHEMTLHMDITRWSIPKSD